MSYREGVIKQNRNLGCSEILTLAILFLNRKFSLVFNHIVTFCPCRRDQIQTNDFVAVHFVLYIFSLLLLLFLFFLSLDETFEYQIVMNCFSSVVFQIFLEYISNKSHSYFHDFHLSYVIQIFLLSIRIQLEYRL